ncbi:hypothetical protein LEP1GSC061_2616 [Leptospira wolffii serovar Khorat str. Khorat-H2]|nr:hypothetical protein LEP1GSC061_2616 [Leptospira wolffii serovar Khorat str. Khorat-H2]
MRKVPNKVIITRSLLGELAEPRYIPGIAVAKTKELTLGLII